MGFFGEGLGRERRADTMRAAEGVRRVAEALRYARDEAARGASGGRTVIDLDAATVTPLAVTDRQRTVDRVFAAIVGNLRRDRRAHPEAWKATRLFRGLSRRELAAVARRVDHVRYGTGALLAREDDPAPQVFILTAGVAEATRGGGRVGVLTAGDHFGETTILEGDRDVPTVAALTDVEALVLSRRDFWSLLHEVPGLAARLAADLAGELRRARTAAPVRSARAAGSVGA